MIAIPGATIAAFSNAAEGTTALVKERARGFFIYFTDNDGGVEFGFVRVLSDRAEAIAFAAELAGGGA